MNWQPIETAPKKGAKVLVIEDGNHAIAFWLPEPPMWIELGGRRITPTHWMPIPPPPVVNDSLTPALPMDDDPDEPLGPAPTHWMPLPPPPTDETK